jgi:predicted Fe-S protein YdhL (DUF1289 family)
VNGAGECAPVKSACREPNATKGSGRSRTENASANLAADKEREGWWTLQVSNLQKEAGNKGVSAGDAQRDAQTLGAACRDLSRVVANWAALSAPIRAAILALVDTALAQQGGAQ